MSMNQAAGDTVKNGFCVLVDVHEMAKICKILCKQYVSTEKIFKSPNILWLFCELY